MAAVNMENLRILAVAVYGEKHVMIAESGIPVIRELLTVFNPMLTNFNHVSKWLMKNDTKSYSSILEEYATHGQPQVMMSKMVDAAIEHAVKLAKQKGEACVQ